MTTVSAERLAQVFVEVADTFVKDFELLEFMQVLTERAADLVGATAVGLLLADQRGQLRFFAASTEDAKLVELFQLQSDEGPCLEAFRTATLVVNADLADAQARWPRFAPRATAAGFRSVHAFPLRLRSEVIGALNVFGGDPRHSLHDDDVPIVQALADIAAISLLQERAIRRGELLSEQLQGALNTRIIIEQAKGAIAQAHGVSVNEAFALIRDHARRTNRRLGDVAHAVVADVTILPDPSRR